MHEQDTRFGSSIVSAPRLSTSTAYDRYALNHFLAGVWTRADGPGKLNRLHFVLLPRPYIFLFLSLSLSLSLSGTGGDKKPKQTGGQPTRRRRTRRRFSRGWAASPRSSRSACGTARSPETSRWTPRRRYIRASIITASKHLLPVRTTRRITVVRTKYFSRGERNDANLYAVLCVGPQTGDRGQVVRACVVVHRPAPRDETVSTIC